MQRDELIQALHRLKVQTGGLACVYRRYEHNCSVNGCAIIRATIEKLEKKSPPIGQCVDCKYAHVNSFSMVSGLVLCLRFNNSGIKFGMQYNDYCSYFEPKGK